MNRNGTMKPNILILTPLHELPLVERELKDFGELIYELSGNTDTVNEKIALADYIFTNPNKNTVFLGAESLKYASNLRAISTASTGLTHIDQEYLTQVGIKLISLRDERELLNQLPSTAELAVGLTFLGLRNLVAAVSSASQGEWDYEKFIGRQLGGKRVGVVGIGRLGLMYSKFMMGMGAEVAYYDPNVNQVDKFFRFDSFSGLIEWADILSFHAHVNPSSFEMLNKKTISVAKKNIIIINTARGELINEIDLLDFLADNKEAKYLADVYTNEHLSFKKSPIYAALGPQVIVTPHIGGMTEEGRAKAFLCAAKNLKKFHLSYSLK
jgi:phosphoglycerate dehydrogenase-like enzyme